MRWVDVAGPPGCGKSTVCYPIWGDKSVTGDGKLPAAYWRPFIDEITALMHLVHDHPTFIAVVRMNVRSVKKMACVERMWLVEPDDVFIQTGLVQRVLGFGWRLQEMGRDINLIRRALWYMPVSVGVAFLEAPLEVLLERNRGREQVAETAHENRSHQVPLMLPSIALAKEVLRERGVPVVEISTHQAIDDARAELVAFAARPSDHGSAARSGGQMALLQGAPDWLR